MRLSTKLWLNLLSRDILALQSKGEMPEDRAKLLLASISETFATEPRLRIFGWHEHQYEAERLAQYISDNLRLYKPNV